MARARAQANAKITAAQIGCKILTKREVELLYFHYVYGTYRSSTLTRRDKDETELFIDTHKHTCEHEEEDKRHIVLSENEIESLSVSDKRLDFSAFCEGIAHLSVRAEPLERIRYLFQVYDGDLDGLLSRKELFEMLSSNLDLSALVEDSLCEDDRERSRERTKTRLYTWLKRYFPRYASKQSIGDDGSNNSTTKEKGITLSRTHAMLCKERCGTVQLIDEIKINVSSIMSMLADRDMAEFAEESKVIVGLPSFNPFVGGGA